MNILTINTASKTLAVDLNGKGERILERTKASEKLLIAIENQLNNQNCTLLNIDVFACVNGPGSFTGIRIGITTVKAFAYALNKKVLPVNSLLSLAYNDLSEINTLAVSDAGNAFLYAALYDQNKNELIAPDVYTFATLNELTKKITVPFNAVIENGVEIMQIDNPLFKKLIEEQNDTKSLFLAAKKSLEKFGTVDYDNLDAIYIRKSQAEEDEEKLKGKI